MTRYIAIHSGVDGKTIERNLEQYNTPRNAMGNDIMIIIGSRIMQESREVRNTENIMISHKPDNISAMIQIIGRVVRTNSHSDLPADRHNVDVRIYVSSNGDDTMTYAESKYKEKIKDYKTIQKIEKNFHEVAVDSAINHPTIEKALTKEGIGDLKFDPKYVFKPMPLDKLRMSTFTVYHAQSEMTSIIYVIKRLFVERSPVWTYDELWKAVQSTKFTLPVNPQIFDENNFIIALSQLSNDKQRSVIVNDMKSNKRMYLDRLFDEFDRRMVLPSSLIHGNGSAYGVIVQMAEYYILFPMDTSNQVRIGVEMPYRIFTQSKPKYINILGYLERSLSFNSYTDRKLQFKQKYEKTDIDQMGNTVCDLGLEFHIQFIEDCIEYIFNIWTDPSKVQSEYHEFYFKMIYYYDIIGIVAWANTVSAKHYKMYGKYVLDMKGQTTSRRSDTIENINAMNSLNRSISNTNCSWCPAPTRNIYESSLVSTLSKFAKKIQNAPTGGIIKVDPGTLPVGHMLRGVPHFYIPDSGWFSSPEYGSEKEWKENDIIIGYGDRSKTGVHVRFKLRKPIHKMKKVDDVRQQQRGTICSSINKTRLFKIAKEIGMDTKKISATKLCDEIKARLLYLDLEERRKKTNIKWFYNFYEKQPSITE